VRYKLLALVYKKLESMSLHCIDIQQTIHHLNHTLQSLSVYEPLV